MLFRAGAGALGPTKCKKPSSAYVLTTEGS